MLLCARGCNALLLELLVLLPRALPLWLQGLLPVMLCCLCAVALPPNGDAIRPMDHTVENAA